MKNTTLIGRNSHYYVKKGGLTQDFQEAFEIALEEATERIADEIGLAGTTNQRLTEILANVDDVGAHPQAELVEIDTEGNVVNGKDGRYPNLDLNDDDSNSEIDCISPTPTKGYL